MSTRNLSQSNTNIRWQSSDVELIRWPKPKFCVIMRNKMMEANLDSVFANLQFVSLYARGPADCLDFRRARAVSVLARAEKQWPGNSLVRSLRTPLLVKLYNL
jgi:hypothetical protein